MEADNILGAVEGNALPEKNNLAQPVIELGSWLREAEAIGGRSCPELEGVRDRRA